MIKRTYDVDDRTRYHSTTGQTGLRNLNDAVLLSVSVSICLSLSLSLPLFSLSARQASTSLAVRGLNFILLLLTVAALDPMLQSAASRSITCYPLLH